MLSVVRAPDPRLRIKTKYVHKILPKHIQIIREMEKLTKSFKDPEGVGLASTQIGEVEQYFLMIMPDETFKAILNPSILSYSKRTKVFFEGCLSIPNYWGEIKRPTSVKVQYMDIKGQMHTEKLVGLQAWIFQHEYDHLQGKLFMDMVHEQHSKLFKVVGKDRSGAEVFEEVVI